VTSTDGVTTTVGDREPITDSLRQLAVAHGALVHSQSFRYDSQERLSKRWDNLGLATEANPDEILAYRYATATQPAAVSGRLLVDSAAASARQAVDLLTAGGEPFSRAQLAQSGWVFDRLITRVRARGETNSLVRPGLAAASDPSALDYPTLSAGTQTVSTTHASSLGVTADSVTRFHANVSRTTQTRLSLGGGLLAAVETENGVLSTTRTLDVAQRLVGYDDQANVHWSYTYDALGRLRVVTLPDGTRHCRDIDDYGRDLRITRDGIGIVDNTYDATTGLLRTTRDSAPDGTPIRAVNVSYDPFGRKVSEQHVDLVGGATEAFAWYYDGATPASPTARTTPGLLTAVTGDAFTKLMEYRADGRISRRVLQLAGWYSVDTTLDYTEDGQERSDTTVVRAADNTVVSTTTLANQFDSYGRVGALTLGGAPLATLAYDENNQLYTATFSGGTATFTYEPLTRAKAGFAQSTGSWATQNAFNLNNRGLIDSELLSVGNQSVTRGYGYSPRAFLTSSVDAQASYQYDYDALGLPSRIVDATGDRSFTRAGNTLTVGGVEYTFDSIGRTIQRGDLQLTYGPDGQVSSAQRGTSQWSFKYDEKGQRIIKLAAGVPVAAYIPEGYLDATGLTEPIKIGGSAVAVVQAGALKLVPLDSRGSIVGNEDGTPLIPSPFGDRAQHPDLAAAIDYVQRGYDADLGVVRMGVRDYDPRISRFLTPDPLYLVQPDRCLKSPVDCSLYSYAVNDPQQYVDPSGTQERPAFAEYLQQLPPFRAQAVEFASNIVNSDSVAGKVGWTVAYLANAPMDLSEKVVGGVVEAAHNMWAGAHNLNYMNQRNISEVRTEDGQLIASRDEALLDVVSGVQTFAAPFIKAPPGALLENSAKVTLVSRIKESSALVREASKLEGLQQDAINTMQQQLSAGYMDPGIGTKYLFNGVLEARAKNGARLYFRNAGKDTVEILGKSTKANQAKVIGILQSLYDK
jgi:RHS repeat-associated protein